MKSIISIALVTFCLAFIGSIQVIAQEKEYTIENCVNHFTVDKATKTESGYRYWFADKDFIDGRTLKLSVVAPHQATHPPHAHEVDEFFFVLEGTAKFYLDGETAVAGPYTSFYCPSNVAHGISNAGDTELKYLVIKKYPKPPTIAFPGAEGAGKFAEGGRGGDVYHVTNLNDSGLGSLRQGIESICGPRTIVFDIGGTIRLKSPLKIEEVSHLTIAGQTAPGKGITLADYQMEIRNSKHIIVRYLRIRVGDENKPAGSDPDCITVNYDEQIILDHLSLSWGIDGNGDFRGLKTATLQWIIFSEALHNSIHRKGAHAMCTSFRDPKGPATLHHNIYASSRSRHPTINGGDDVTEFCNNVNYNWSNAQNIEGDQLNLINNYFKAGPMMNTERLPIQIKTQKDPVTAKGYFKGNHFEGLPPEYNKDNYTAMDYNKIGLGFGTETNYRSTTREQFEHKERFNAGPYALKNIESAKEAFESCLKYSGCSLIRDKVDERFIKTIVDNTGALIDSQSEVGGWDFYPQISRPVDWDTDKDGISDEWEKDHNLDPSNPDDRNGDADKDGFTNLEEYLHSLTVRP